MRATCLGALLLVLTAGLSGCSGDDTPDSSPRETLAAAKRNLDATSGVRIGLATERLPSGVDGLLSATGVGTHDPAFSGDITVFSGNVTAEAAVVAVDDVVYAKLPFRTTYDEVDPADFSAPDPADLMATDGGLSSLLTSATDVELGKRVRDGKVVLSSYTAKVPGRAVATVIPSAEASAEFDATFTVTDDQRLSRAVLSGPFYPEAEDVTYQVTFDDYGTKKQITAP